jgi:hypothetical protein
VYWISNSDWSIEIHTLMVDVATETFISDRGASSTSRLVLDRDQLKALFEARAGCVCAPSSLFTNSNLLAPLSHSASFDRYVKLWCSNSCDKVPGRLKSVNIVWPKTDEDFLEERSFSQGEQAINESTDKSSRSTCSRR